MFRAFNIDVNGILESILTCCICSYDVHACCHVLPLITTIGPCSSAVTCESFQTRALILISCDSQTNSTTVLWQGNCNANVLKAIIQRSALDAMQICDQVLHMQD